MRKAALLLMPAAATMLVGGGTAAADPPGAGGGTRDPIVAELHGCDFTKFNNPSWGTMPFGSGEADIRVSGGSVIADIRFVNTRQPGFHYDVDLIQLPRPLAAPCGPGAPGTASAGMDLDEAGRATLTLQSPISSGSTGAWVKITRPSDRSQMPTEFYSTMFVAKI